MAQSVRMSGDEAWGVVERAHSGVLTSLRRDGSPISLPVWFVALDRHVFVAGPADTKKFARIRNDARVSFLVESGTSWAELVGVHLTGCAEFVPEGSRFDDAMKALHSKYREFRTPRAEMPSATRAQYESGTALIEIVPDDRILSWDNARLFPNVDA
jgi:nitroimidazol reductase NimA-like FMN-containing flavoprotein (pyridoxamine 5'-phosphate oxidase superfamily)